MNKNTSLVLLLISLGLGNTGCSSYTAVDLKPGPGVPPDPGRQATNQTLLGIDSDNDGVRDDVQRYIMALDIDHPFFVRGLLQYAESMQTALKESNKPELAQRNLHLTDNATSCYYAAVIDLD